MLALIEQASDYILINSFITRADPTSVEVLEALKRKHDAGVRVYIISDSSSNFMNWGREGFEFLDEAGIPNVEYNPIRVYRALIFPVMIQRDHRKFWVIDGKKLFAGGANICWQSLDPVVSGNSITREPAEVQAVEGTTKTAFGSVFRLREVARMHRWTHSSSSWCRWPAG